MPSKRPLFHSDLKLQRHSLLREHQAFRWPFRAQRSDTIISVRYVLGHERARWDSPIRRGLRDTDRGPDGGRRPHSVVPGTTVRYSPVHSSAYLKFLMYLNVIQIFYFLIQRMQVLHRFRPFIALTESAARRRLKNRRQARSASSLSRWSLLVLDESVRRK